MTTINITKDTIYLLVGPSGCGKSTFTQELVDKCPVPVTHLSSDNNRYFLRKSKAKTFGYLDASEQAFNLLFSQLENSISFPVSLYNPVIVVDTTGLDKSFRDKVVELANKHHYQVKVVIFYYGNNIKKYLTEAHQDNPEQINITTKHISKLQHQFKYIGSKNFVSEYVISSKGDYEFNFNVIPRGLYYEGFEEPLIIGDIHGQLYALVELVEGYLASSPSYKNIILVGDYIDKAPDWEILATIDYLYSLQFRCRLLIVRGNHEQRVYEQLIKGQLITGEYSKYYSTLPLLLHPEYSNYKNMFMDLYENYTYPYIRFNTESFESSNYRDVIIVHSPCKLKYLCKDTPDAIKKQTKTYYPKSENPLDDLYPFVENSTFPIIVWGHTSVKKATKVNNRVFLDSGACKGNLLTGYLPYSNKFIEVKCKSNVEFAGNLIDIDPEYFKTNNLEVPERFKGELPIRYVSPTMSPVDKSDVWLEDITEGFKYYFSQSYTNPDFLNITSVQVQLKYMGSRLQAYYHKTTDVPESPYVYQVDDGYMYFVTKGGYLAYKDLSPICETVKNIAEKYNATDLIVDGELLPWNLFAQGLIDDFFIEYYTQIQSNLEFQSHYLGTNVTQEFSLLEKFKTQLDAYSQSTPVTYYPFDILYLDGKVGLNLPVCEHSVLITKEEFENGTYLDKLNSLNPDNLIIEGYVLKPQHKELEVSYAPYLKARTSEYLTLVYGYDYTNPDTLEKLMRNKNTRHKIKVSIKQYNIANKLLTLTDYTSKQAAYYYSQLLELQDIEKTLDPRL